MRRNHSVPFFLFVFAGFFCRAQEQGALDNMSSAKAIEQETFVQGCIDKSLGNYTKALVDFQKCLSMDKKSAATNYEIAGVYLQLKQFDQALIYAKAADELSSDTKRFLVLHKKGSPDNHFYKLRYAEALQANNQNAEAVKVFKALSDNDPKNADLLFRYADALRKVGENSDALKVYDKIESIEGISDTLANEKIAVCEIIPNKEEEENTLKGLVKYFPTEKNYYRLGDFYEKNHEPAKEEMLYGEMQTVFPQAVRLQLKRAWFEKHSDALSDRPQAFITAKNAFGFPEDLDAKIEYLNSNYPIADSSKALGKDELSEADTLCSILRKTNPDDARVFSLSGDYLFKEGKFSDAKDFYHQAAALGQTEYGSWKRLMTIDYNLKDDVAQEKDCKQVIDLFPNQPDAYYYLAVLSYNKKDFKKANNWLQLGLDQAPDDARMNECMGNIQYRLGNADAALTYWQKAKEKGGSNEDLDRKISSKKMNDNE